MSMLEGLAARVKLFGFLALAGAAFMAGGDIWRSVTEEVAQARVVAVKEACWLTVIGSDGRPRIERMSCADAERAKAARTSEAAKVGRNIGGVTLEFKTQRGETVRIEPGAGVLGLARAKVGDVVRLAYDPAKPRSVHKPTRLDNLTAAKWVGIAGIVLLWLSGVLRKAGAATKDGWKDLAEALRRSAESTAARKPAGGGFAAMDRLASAAAVPTGKPAPAVRAKTPSRAPVKPLPKGTPRVVSPRRHGLLGLFR